MAEQVTKSSNNNTSTSTPTNLILTSNQNEKRKKSPDAQIINVAPGNMSRERSFVRATNHQNLNKRRSLAFNQQSNLQQHQNQIRGKPALEIYRPPKLNYNLQHTSSSSSVIFPTQSGHLLQQSKSNTNIQQIQHLTAAVSGRHNNIHHHHHHHHQHQITGTGGNSNVGSSHRTILVTHPMQIGQMGVGVAMQSSQLPLVNSPSSGNILHQSTPHRVKFAPDTQTNRNHSINYNNNHLHNNGLKLNSSLNNPLQRSKSLSSADALARGLAGLGLALNEATDIGIFLPEIQLLVDKAIEDPNQLTARSLMELAVHVMQRAVEGRRYALPISRLCISIIAKERNETFLEALLNTCRQWYQEREKILYVLQGLKSPSRMRFTAFMAFLTEMFCQLKRRQLQLRTQCDGVPPPLVLLTLLSKCCEDCVKPPIRSLSEIECLFFVLTCIGRDLENHLPQQLESLLSSVRDAFLNSNTSAPTIRRTLLQLIELQASHWQLPGNTVLYYYPSSK